MTGVAGSCGPTQWPPDLAPSHLLGKPIARKDVVAFLDAAKRLDGETARKIA
jgi:hypothetical protein